MQNSEEYNKGFAAGWLAASRAMINSMLETRSMLRSLEMAGSLPTTTRPRRGRPPLNQAAASEAPAKRRRGRPRKSA